MRTAANFDRSLVRQAQQAQRRAGAFPFRHLLLAWSVTFGLVGFVLPGRTDTLAALYSFSATTGSYPGPYINHDGANPQTALIQAKNGSLYGTTHSGGANGSGTIFNLTTGGALTSLYSFGALSGTLGTDLDGAYPNALLQAKDGNFYGTCPLGGANGSGTVFKITATGAFTALHTFSALNNGYYGANAEGGIPFAALIQARDGNLYGTTSAGGANGTGGVFKITTSGKLTLLHAFSALSNNTNADGATPHAGLIQAKDGNLYGTTSEGGAHGTGVVFKITTTGTFTLLYNFGSNPNDGAYPQAALIQASDGNLYGTTSEGGTNGSGVVFKITTAGTLTSLYRFGSNPYDGYAPDAGLIQAKDGNLYGTCRFGGIYGNGTVFNVTLNAVFTSLYNFRRTRNNLDGEQPDRLIQAGDGNLYGACTYGGVNGSGTIFQFSIASPYLTALSPTSAQANTAFTLTIQGSNFILGSIAYWNGYPLSTTYISGNQITADVPETLNGLLGFYPEVAQISVIDPDGVGSNRWLTITTPTPILQQLMPASLPAGSPASTLEVTGNAFTPGAVVNWNGTPLATTLVSSTQMTAIIPASYLAQKGTAQVSVTNPNGGGASQVLTFTID